MTPGKFNQIRLTTNQFAAGAAFERESRCVCALFARCARARGAVLPETRSIVGDFRRPQAAAETPPDAADVVRLVQFDDIRDVMSLPDSERKRAFLHLILRTLDLFFDGATPPAWLAAAADVRAADFVNRWAWAPGAQRSPDRRRRCSVDVTHELRDFEIRLAVDDARGLPAFETVLVRGDEPDERLIHGWLGELRWDGPERIVLVPGDERLAPLVVDLPSQAAGAAA